MGVFSEIRERRVLPAVGVYIGACWVLVEILDRLVERYYLSPYLTDIVFWGLYSLIPAVLLLAWTHGRPGKDRVTRAEMLGLPINIIVSAGLLFLVFGGKDLGATADLVTVANELGQEEAHYVARESYRRRVAIFFWSNESGDPALDWLQFAVTELLSQDLQQSPFLVVSNPWGPFGRDYHAQMRAAGYDEGLGLPRNLQRDIARAAGRDYFIEGDVQGGSGRLSLVARVWRTEDMDLLGTVSEDGDDILELADRLSSAVRDLFGIPAGAGGASDLPLRETYGESELALRRFVEARNALLFDNDWDRSNALFDESLAADPGFVLAWLHKGLNLWEQGNASSARESLLQAQEYAWRLPERARIALKGLTYRISGDQDKLEKLLRLQVRLQDDAAAHRDLAKFLMLTGRLDQAKSMYLEAMRRDRSDRGSFVQLARLERATGNTGAAIDYLQQYLELRPEDLEARLMLGDLLRDSGDLPAARDVYVEAQLLGDRPVTATLRLADLALRDAEWNLGIQLIDEARLLAVTAAQQGEVLHAEGALALRRGHVQRAIDLAGAQAEINRQFMTPLEQVFSYYMPVIQYDIMLGRLDEAESLLASLQAQIEPPLDRFLAFIEAVLQARRGEFGAAEAAAREGALAIEQFKADYLAFQVPMVSAEIARSREEFAEAARLYRQAVDLATRSLVAKDFSDSMSQILGLCAQMYVRAGALDQARQVLAPVLQRDPSEPSLWVARAMLHKANGNPRMALASADYALAIWADADPDYLQYLEALDLRERLLDLSSADG